ncbi:sensor histidine kinase [Nocardioides sp. Root151]|uniref:sensor histidine kinase n=1 Tax=Nocardioides sp. Root151 TaxID=1736475 RepID=UPI0007030742|nr:HAMP domain-containing sensor histidine kinase [Nocardioides sp. Root151]KQZ70782.1 hypothetical protein ASD66_14540 [Nocardioides sp. Root151]
MRHREVPALGRGGSFRTQLLALTVSVTALGVLALTVLVQVVLARSTNHNLDTVLADRAEAVISSARTDTDGRLDVPDARLDAGVAVYDGSGRLIAGNAPSSEQGTYDALSRADRPRTVNGSSTDETRVRAEPFTVPGGASGVVVVTERLAPYERSERQALFVSIGAGLLMIGFAAALTHWVTRRALAPVTAMAKAADDWSEHDLTHRFHPGDGRNEIASLGRTFDGLLERVAATIRSEQRLTSELAHELRTPLTVIQANADLALMEDPPPHLRELLDEITSACARMGSVIESLLELARTDNARGVAATCSLRDAVLEAISTVGSADVRVEISPMQRVRLPTHLVVRATAPVLENAVRLANRVEVSSAPGLPGFIELCFDDDGPGIAEADRDRVFEPGHSTGSGAGLGLSLSRRIARSMGGDVTIGDPSLSTRLVVTLPSA